FQPLETRHHDQHGASQPHDSKRLGQIRPARGGDRFWTRLGVSRRYRQHNQNAVDWTEPKSVALDQSTQITESGGIPLAIDVMPRPDATPLLGDLFLGI